MAEAHIAALLPTQNRVVGADENTTFLAHYDLNEHDVLRNVKAAGFSTSIALNGSTQNIDCGDADVLSTSFSQGITVEGWGMQTAASTADAWLLDKDITGYRLWGTGKLIFNFRSPSNGSWISVDSGVTLSLNTWYHIAGVVDNANLKAYVYINGALKSTVTLSAAVAFGVDNNTGLGLKIGSHSNGGTKWPGKAANVKIWKRPLSISEINQSMNNQLSTDYPGLVAWWKLDEGQGTIARDSSIFQNDGIINGGATWSTGNSVFTLRPKEGYFGGGAIAVEEGTTNLINPSTALSGWTNSVFTRTLVSGGQWDGWYRVDVTNVGTSNHICYIPYVSLSANTSYTFSIEFYAPNNDIRMSIDGSSSLGSLNNTVGNKYTKTVAPSAAGTFNFWWYHKTITDAAVTTSFYYRLPQAEQRAYATSFVNGARVVGNLLYMIPMAQNPFTINFWLKTEGQSGSYPFYFNMYPSGVVDGNNRIYLRPTDNTTISAGRVVNGTATTMTSATVSDITNGWHMYTLTSSGTNMSLYYDGNLATSSTSVPDLPAGTNMLLELYQTTPSFSALIDELRIDKVARTDAEIAAWYYSASPFWPRGIYRKPY
jgi:hypothetical protein